MQPAIKSTYTPERSSFNKTVNHIWDQLKPEPMQNKLKFNSFLSRQIDEDFLEITEHAKVSFSSKQRERMLISVFRVKKVNKHTSQTVECIYQPNLYNEQKKVCISAYDNFNEDQLIQFIYEETNKEYVL
jgi:hypothetical protein